MLDALIAGFNFTKGFWMMGTGMDLINPFHLQIFFKPVDPMPRIKYKPAVCQKLFHLSITAHCFAHHLDHLICRCLFNKVPSQNETGIIIQQKKKIYFELVYIKLKNIHLRQFKWTGC